MRHSYARFGFREAFLAALSAILLIGAAAYAQDSRDGRRPPPTGADGVSFMPIAMDNNLNCNSVILRGTQGLQGTAFLLPRVVVGQNKQRETLFEVTRTPNHRYLLRIAIYFPRTEEELKLRMKDSPLEIQGCSIEAVLAWANSRSKSATDRIDTVARVPISSIDVRIDGIDQAYTIGKAESSIIDYQGRDLVAEFKISSEQALQALLDRIESGIGLGIHIAIKFNARANDGAFNAKVNLSALAAAIEAGAGTRKFLTSIDLQALIRANIQNLGVNITSEDGSSEVFDKVAADLMTLISDGLNSTSNNYSDLPLDQNPPDSTLDPIDGGQGRPSRKKGRLLSIVGVLQALRTKKTYNFNYQNAGPSEQQIYSTSVAFHGQIGDPDVKSVLSSTWPENSRTLSVRFAKQAKFSFAAASVTRDVISYKSNSTSFVNAQTQELDQSEQSIATLPLAFSFSKIGPKKFKIGDLMKSNELWDSKWDDLRGKFEFSPREDLGQITIFNLDPVTWRSAGGERIPVSRTQVKLLLTNESDVQTDVVARVTPDASTSATDTVLIPTGDVF